MLLALADKVPNEEAIAVAPTLGWLLLACAVCAAVIFVVNAERWRRWWLIMEDPRGIAVFRIVFAFVVMANVNGLWEFFNFLFTDEGIFPADVARQVHAGQQFAGFGDGFTSDDPWGFYDFAAFIEFIKGPKYSLLLFWDSPTFFWAHLWAFEIVTLLFLVGFRTRLTGVLSMLLMHSIFFRTHLFWEGTEVVYRCFFTYLIFSRSGAAYSVDNWLRCKKLRKQGRLSEPGGPGGGAGLAPSEAHPEGLEPVYKLIPGWPRRLIMLQLATIYIYAGTCKTGSVWLNGDALYYALNLDHFYRVPPQFMASHFGTNVFRAMTWSVKVGQTGFSLVIVGLIARFIIKNKFTPLPRASAWAQRIAWAGIIVGSAGVVYVAWPVHFTPPISRAAFAATWVAVWLGLWWLWRRLADKPWTVRGVVVDREFVCRWFLGRRVWLIFHLAFHAHIFILMNVGQFQTVMISGLFAFLEGREIAGMMRALFHRLAKYRVPFIPKDVAAGEPIIPEQDPTLPQLRRDSATLPVPVLLVALTIVVAGIVVRALWNPEAWDWRWIWVAAVVYVGVVAYQRARRSKGKPLPIADENTGKPRPPWAYGPFGRLVIGLVLAWHLPAVATWLLPDKDCLRTFRAPARKVFSKWLVHTYTDQGWGMFAPNPPRTNVFLKVLVTDARGEVWDLRSDVYAEEQKPIPWIWNTRLRKMNRRIIGGESGNSQWYRKWYARFECRQWAREHGGEAPRKVELVKLWYRIPSPEVVRDKGYYVPEELLIRSGHEKIEHTEHCRRTVMGQLPDYIRERDGLPLLGEDEPYRPWIKHKRRKWEKRKEKKAREK